MFCTECGQPLRTVDKFCAQCGTPSAALGIPSPGLDGASADRGPTPDTPAAIRTSQSTLHAGSQPSVSGTASFHTGQVGGQVRPNDEAAPWDPASDELHASPAE